MDEVDSQSSSPSQHWWSEDSMMQEEFICFSNFTSKVFTQILRELGIQHQLASAYHPESQDALERFHQMLKSMLRKFCTETGREWVEGLPLMMFTIRESVQQSTGFSPAELVFGHTVRGPLCLLREQLLSQSSAYAYPWVCDFC